MDKYKVTNSQGREIGTVERQLTGAEIGAGIGASLVLGHLLFTTLRNNADSQAAEGILSALNKGEHEQSVKLADALVKRRPRNAGAYTIRGSLYYRLDREEDAIKDLSKAIELDESLEDAFFARSRCYQSLGDWGNAIRDINRAIQLNSKVYYYYGVRGLCLSKLGNTDQAIIDLNRAVEIDPTDPFIYSCRGEIYMLCRNFNKSIADFSLAINLSSNEPEPTFYRLRGEVYSLIGDNENSSRDNTQAKALEERQEEQERKKADEREEQKRKKVLADATERINNLAGECFWAGIFCWLFSFFPLIFTIYAINNGNKVFNEIDKCGIDTGKYRAFIGIILAYLNLFAYIIVIGWIIFYKLHS